MSDNVVDPLVLLASDRSVARDRQDPLVDRCVLGTLTREGRAALRTLVLRDIDERLAIFYSRSSAKHLELMNHDCQASLLVWLPSIEVQYRLEAQFEEMPKVEIDDRWQLKPNAAKRLDAIYERSPQSTLIEDVERFETLFAATVPPVRAPHNATGCYIKPMRVERLALRKDPHMHDRRAYTRNGEFWTMRRLVP